MRKYDFALNWSGTVKEFFVAKLQNNCQRRKFSFLWVSQDNVKEVLKDLESGRIKIRVLLDTEATYNKKDDLYARVCYAVKDTGGIVINDPDRTKFAIDKSILHYELINANINVPYTIVIRNWEPNNFKLSDQERHKLKVPFIIKPALGYGQLGVIKEANGSIREIAKARHFDRGDNFLLQEKIVPIELGGIRGWFRVFNVFDTIIPCWWDDCRNIYKHVNYEEFSNYRLSILAKIASKIASITRMVWFSTEVAVYKEKDKRRFVAIDYVNDQCDMSARSETSSGVPDPIVGHTASYIVESVERLFKHQDINKKYSIILEDAAIDVRGLGTSPSLLKQVYPTMVNNQKNKRKILKIFRQ